MVLITRFSSAGGTPLTYLSGGDEVNLALVVWVKSGVESIGDVLWDGIGEALRGSSLETVHDLGLACFARWIVADENGILAFYPIGLD